MSARRIHRSAGRPAAPLRGTPIQSYHAVLHCQPYCCLLRRNVRFTSGRVPRRRGQIRGSRPLADAFPRDSRTPRTRRDGNATKRPVPASPPRSLADFPSREPRQPRAGRPPAPSQARSAVGRCVAGERVGLPHEEFTWHPRGRQPARPYPAAVLLSGAGRSRALMSRRLSCVVGQPSGVIADRRV